VIVYPHYIRNRSQWNAMWPDNQPHGYIRPILFPHSAKRMPYCGQNHRDCRQNIPWLLWNALLTTPNVSEHYKYMFLVTRDLYEMFVLYRGKHTTQRSTVGIWSTSISYAGHVYTVCRRPVLGQVSRQPALDVQARGKVYQFARMKENVHRGAHALTGLTFAPSEIMFW